MSRQVKAKKPAKAPAKRQNARDKIASQFLALYYPFHYEVGFAVEREMRDSKLTQLQNVILWTLYSADADGEMPRKQLESIIGPWFEVTSSALSKSIRGLTRSPLKLLSLKEHPDSAREKLIRLTPKGREVVAGMQMRGEDIIKTIISELSMKEIDEGLHFLARVSDIVKQFPTDNPSK